MALITLIILGCVAAIVFWWLSANRDKWTPPPEE